MVNCLSKGILSQHNNQTLRSYRVRISPTKPASSALIHLGSWFVESCFVTAATLINTTHNFLHISGWTKLINYVSVVSDACPWESYGIYPIG